MIDLLLLCGSLGKMQSGGFDFVYCYCFCCKGCQKKKKE